MNSYEAINVQKSSSIVPLLGILLEDLTPAPIFFLFFFILQFEEPESLKASSQAGVRYTNITYSLTLKCDSKL